MRMTLDEAIKEITENILTDAEKEYLAAVIKPFKKNIKYITKVRYAMWENDKKAERIEVLTHKSGGLLFPVFEVGTMYKGMEIGKRYTLKELGLE